MTRFATVLLLMAGCSVESQGLSPKGLASGDGDEDAQLDAQISRDANQGDADADTVLPGADAAGSVDDAAAPNGDDGGDANPDQDAATPPTGFQPPRGQVGSRCSAAECSGPGPAAIGSYCAMAGQVPIGSDTGYCTRSCSSTGGIGVGNPCGPGSICVTVNGAGTCQRTCAADSDCRIEDGYYCASSFPLLLFVCWHH